MGHVRRSEISSAAAGPEIAPTRVFVGHTNSLRRLQQWESRHWERHSGEIILPKFSEHLSRDDVSILKLHLAEPLNLDWIPEPEVN